MAAMALLLHVPAIHHLANLALATFAHRLSTSAISTSSLAPPASTATSAISLSFSFQENSCERSWLLSLLRVVAFFTFLLPSG